MTAPPILVTLEPQEDGKLVYLPAAPKASDEPGTSLLAFRATMQNIGTGTERLTGISVVLRPLPGQPGNPSPQVFSFSRDVAVGGGSTKVTQIKKDELIIVPLFALSHAEIRFTFDGHDGPIVLIRQVAPHRSPTPHGSYRFFGRAQDMGFDEYFFQSRHDDDNQYFEYDMKVCGWNDDLGRLASIRTATSGSRNEDYFGYGKPLYAMADGTVISFANDYDENPAPGLRALIPVSDANAGLVSALDLARLRRDCVVTAVRTFQGTLKLIVWQIVDEGNVLDAKLERLGDIEGGAIDDVALTAASTTRLFTAARSDAGTLEVGSWNVSANGMALTAGATGTGGITGAVAIASLTESRIVVAVRAAGGTLKLIVWDLSADGSSLTRVGEATAGAIEKVALVTLSSGRVLTAVRTGTGKLKVIVWDISRHGSVTRRGDAEAGTISDVSAALVNRERGRIVTAVVTGAKLKSIIWETGADGNVTRTGDLLAHRATKVSAGAYQEPDDYATCTIGFDGRLIVSTWKSASESTSAVTEVVRYSENKAGKVTLAKVAWLEIRDRHFIVAAVKTESGALKLKAWWLASKSGNHFRILHGDELVAFFHLKKGTLNPELCEVGAVVEEGQFLAKLGNSGASGSPHCHIEARKVLGKLTVPEIIAAHEAGTLDAHLSARPMVFHDAQSRRKADVKKVGGVDNKFGDVDRQGFYWQEQAIWPGPTAPGIPVGNKLQTQAETAEQAQLL